ncbi:MAG: hypothetical protein HY318_14370 [Armatimonadetes bacterium]|nr:hypothetical protein [Armatimonadota bacterium]
MTDTQQLLEAIKLLLEQQASTEQEQWREGQEMINKATAFAQEKGSMFPGVLEMARKQNAEREAREQRQLEIEDERNEILGRIADELTLIRQALEKSCAAS